MSRLSQYRRRVDEARDRLISLSILMSLDIAIVDLVLQPQPQDNRDSQHSD